MKQESIATQLLCIENIAISLGQHPFIAHACLNLEKEVVQKKDVATLCSILVQVGLDKRIEVVQNRYRSRIERKLLELKILALQHNINITTLESSLKSNNTEILIEELERQLHRKK